MPWWNHPLLAQLTLSKALTTLLHPQELSLNYIHRNGKRVFPLRQSQTTMSRCYIYGSIQVLVLMQQSSRPPSSYMKASYPKRGLMSQLWQRCELERQCQVTCLSSSTTVTPMPSTTLCDHTAILACYWPSLMGIHLLRYVLGRGSWGASRVHFEFHHHPMLPQLLLCIAYDYSLSLHHGSLPPLLYMQARSNGQFLYIKTSWQCTWPTCPDISIMKFLVFNSLGMLFSDFCIVSTIFDAASSFLAFSFTWVRNPNTER